MNGCSAAGNPMLGPGVDQFKKRLHQTATWDKKPPRRATPETATASGSSHSNGATTGGPAAAKPADDDITQLSDDDLGLVRADAVKICPIKWLWPYRLAEGEMALLSGDGGLGKSSILLHIAARISRGSEWPDHSGCAAAWPSHDCVGGG